MNITIKKQLNSCKIAQIPQFDDTTTEIIIPKLNHIVAEIDKCYLVCLQDNLLTDTNSALNLNWNHGNIPKYKYYKIDVNNIMAQMIKVTGIAFDPNENKDINEIWEGWLPLKDIKIMKKI